MRLRAGARRLVLALALGLAGAGCGLPQVRLDPRTTLAGSGAAGDAQRAALALRYGALADTLQATAAFYERQEEKAHVKARIMSVLVGVGASVAGATSGALGVAPIPNDWRVGVATAGISAAVFAGAMAILPWAHQYGSKENGYREKARAVRGSYVDIEARCGPALMADPAATVEALAGCVDEAQRLVAESRAFPAGSPCRPPPEGELREMIGRGR